MLGLDRAVWPGDAAAVDPSIDSEPAPWRHCTLRAATPAGWGQRAIAHLPLLLVEQAHLEKKAAAAAVRLMFQVPQEPRLQAALSALAREELVHFERTLRLLRTRGIALATLPPSRYAESLKRAVAPTMPERLIDELLVAALIEARSHERMAALAAALHGTDDTAAAFYRELVDAEARHRGVYLDVAAAFATPDAIGRRWDVLAAAEAAAVALPFEPRLHGGAGVAAGAAVDARG
jgi:tRNA-(ms[2]io[6]A)-hydroxylase